MLQLDEKRRSFWLSVILLPIGGSIFGFLYLIAFVDSRTTVIGSVAAGIAFWSVILFVHWSVGLGSGWRAAFAMSMAGAVGGITWSVITMPDAHWTITAGIGGTFGGLLELSERSIKPTRRRNPCLE